MIFWRTAQASVILTLLEGFFTNYAVASYGTQENVWKSWTGYTIIGGTYSSAATNGGGWKALPIIQATGAWVSDLKYIMWRDYAAVVPNATDLLWST
jgi:hypothetical protein